MEDLVIRITGDVSDIVSKFGEVQTAGEESGGALGIAAGVAAAGFAAIVTEIGLAVSKYAETEAATRSLNQALQSQGIYSQDLVQNYREQAEALGKLTGIDADSIVKAQVRLQTMIGEKQITPELTKAIIDLSVAKNMDLESTAQLIGKGIDGQTTALKRLGIEIDSNLDSQGRMASIIDTVNQKFGGQAEAANQGLGSVKGLKVAFDELQKSIGEKFAPSMTIATRLLTEFVNSIHEKVSPGKKTQIEDLDGQIASLQAKLNNLRANPNYAIQTGNTEADLKKLSNRLDILKAQRDDLARGTAGRRGGGQNVEEKEAADAAEKDRTKRDKARLEGAKDTNEALMLEAQGASKEIITIKKDEASTLKQLSEVVSKEERAALLAKLENLKELEKEFNKHEVEATKTFNEEILVNDKEFQALDEEEKKLFLKRNQHELVKALDTESTARQKAALKRAQDHTKANNQFLQDEIKYGKAYATLKKLQNDEDFKQSQTALNDLSQMASSKNATLKSIGKAAAIANATIKSAEAAIDIYAGFQAAIPYPPVSIPLGIAGAAAALAFGAEQIATITSAAQGGVMSGGIPGVDSIPTLTMPGELVVPTKNFDEVVGSVQNSRGGGQGNSNVSVDIGFDGPEAQQVITLRQNQAKSLGVYRGIS